MLKGNKGITLVALVITIIVLLILAGVSISLVVGDNGIATKATKASKETKISQFYEAAGVALAEMQAEYSDAKATANSAAAGTYFTEGKLAYSLQNQGLQVKAPSGTSAITANKSDTTGTIDTTDGHTYKVGDGHDAITIQFKSADNGYITTGGRPTELTTW